MLRDQQKKLELAARMRELWEGSGVTQEHVADAIGLKHRSYQKALQTGGISYEKLRRLADFHKVEFDWLAKGDSPAQTPDILGAGGEPTQLDRIEGMLNELLAATGTPQKRAKAAARAAARRSQQNKKESPAARPAHKRAAQG